MTIQPVISIMPDTQANIEENVQIELTNLTPRLDGALNGCQHEKSPH